MPPALRPLQLVLLVLFVAGCTSAAPATPTTPPTPTPAAPTATPVPPTPVPPTPTAVPTAGAPSPSPTDEIALTGRIVDRDNGYAITLPPGWLRVDVDEAFLDALAEELGSDDTLDGFLAQFGEQLQALIGAGMSLIAYREEEMTSDLATNVNLLVLPSGPLSLDAIENINVQQIEALPGFTGPLHRERVQLPAAEAVYLAYVLDDGSVASQVQQYLIVAGGNQHWLTATGFPGDSALEDEARSMAESFELLD